MNCSICHKPGHNKKSCQNEPVAQQPKEKQPRGRPRKKRVTEDDILVEEVRAENISEVGGTNVMEEVRAEKVLGKRKKTVAKSGPRKKKVSKSVPTKKSSISGSKQKKDGSCGLNRKSLKRSCTSAFARWLGEPELVHNEDAMDQQVEESQFQDVQDEVQVEEEHELVHNQDQIEIELTGTQVEESQTQDVQDEDQIEPVVEDVQHEVQIQEPVLQVRVRRPSERIIKNKLSKNHHGQGSTPDSALDVDVA